MNTSDDDTANTALEERTKAAFDASVDSLDGRTRSALTQARYAALAEAAKSQRLGGARIWGPLGGVAAAALVLVVMFGPAFHPREQPEAGTPFDDLDIIAEADNLEMLENLDFYAWLDSADAPPNDG